MGFFDSIGLTSDYKPKEVKINPGAFQIPNYYQTRGQINTGMQNAGQRAAPQMGYTQMDNTLSNQARQKQMGGYDQLLSRLNAQYTGAAPSQAELQLKQSNDQLLKQIIGRVANTQGINPALAARMTASTLADQQTQNNLNAAIMRQQEQQNALNSMGNIYNQYGQVRGQDISLSGQEASLKQQADMQNLQAKLQQQQMNDNLVAKYLDAGLTLDMAKQKAAADMQQLQVQQNLGLEGFRSAQNIANQNAMGNFYGQLIGGLSGMMSSGAFSSPQKFNTNTGIGLYNPETGIQYKR